MDNEINSEIENINLWLKLNKLSLNADKTKKKDFSYQSKNDPIYCVINQTYSTSVNFQFTGYYVRLLYVMDYRHTNLVCMKLSKTISFIKRLKLFRIK